MSTIWKSILVHTKRRNCLMQKTMNDVVYVMTNSKLAKNKFRKANEYNMDDIDFDDDWIVENKGKSHMDASNDEVGYQEVWELLGDSRLSERSSPNRGTQCCSQRDGARLSEREVLPRDESRLSEKMSPEREHQFLNEWKSRGFSSKRAYPRLSESLKS
ncbi:hypothetical protein Lal_00036661 [Lupinus albus]|nr:hypothetical protein Lal_00036661 [Lupinus albus]